MFHAGAAGSLVAAHLDSRCFVMFVMAVLSQAIPSDSTLPSGTCPTGPTACLGARKENSYPLPSFTSLSAGA